MPAGARRPVVPPTSFCITCTKSSRPVEALRLNTANELPTSPLANTYLPSALRATSLAPSRPRAPFTPFSRVCLSVKLVPTRSNTDSESLSCPVT